MKIHGDAKPCSFYEHRGFQNLKSESRQKWSENVPEGSIDCVICLRFPGLRNMLSFRGPSVQVLESMLLEQSGFRRARRLAMRVSGLRSAGRCAIG